MTNPAQPVPSSKSFRNRLDLTENPNHIHALALGAVSALEAAEARITELESSQQPRPMADAPRDGEFWAIVPLKYCEHASEEWGQPTYIDRDDGLWATPADDDMFLGWLPLPDQTEVKK